MIRLFWILLFYIPCVCVPWSYGATHESIVDLILLYLAGVSLAFMGYVVTLYKNHNLKDNVSKFFKASKSIRIEILLISIFYLYILLSINNPKAKIN